MRTGREPLYPSRWSSTTSVVTGRPSTAYMIWSDPSGASSRQRSSSHCMKWPASSTNPMRMSAYMVKAASRIHV